MRPANVQPQLEGWDQLSIKRVHAASAGTRQRHAKKGWIKGESVARAKETHMVEPIIGLERRLDHVLGLGPVIERPWARERGERVRGRARHVAET